MKGVDKSTFVGRRNLLDGVVIANEIMEWARKMKKPTLLFKVDFKKAYDMVR